MHRLINRAINDNETCDISPFAIIALQKAYNEGEAWLQAMLRYVHANYESVRDYVSRSISGMRILPLEGTYLAWMDCRSLGIPSEELEEELMKEAKLWLNAGSMYGKEGEGFMRWNLACPRQLVKEGLERFSQFVDKR